MTEPGKKKSPICRSGLIVLPFLILAGLCIAPPTRALFQAQIHLLHAAGPFFPPMAELGVKEGPITPAPRWKESLIAEGKRRFPEDYEVQVGAALLEGTNTYVPGGNPETQQDRYHAFQCRYGVRLAALSARFPARPGPYAHLLRYMTQGTVRVSRDGEVEKFHWDAISRVNARRIGQAVPGSLGNGQPSLGSSWTIPLDKQIGYADSWAAFDRTAAQGEKLDPDNAYFPMMRAIELFDAKRDAEGIAAVLRAGQKKRFEDYANEEAEAEWALCLRVYGPSSALVRQNIASAVVLPHLASLRAMSRLTALFAAQAELEGRTLDGLTLRHAMMQCGVRMREQGYFLGTRTGIGIVSLQANMPGGVPTIPPLGIYSSNLEGDRHRDLYPAYLHKIGAEEEVRWFAGVDAVDRQVGALINTANKDDLTYAALRPLPPLWMGDMLLLTNMLAMLLFCTAAAVCARQPKGEQALPLVVFVLLACCLSGVLTMRWADALTQVRWLLNGMENNNNSWHGPDFLNVPRVLSQFPGAIHVGEVLFALVIPVQALLALGVGSAVRREAFSVALLRGLQRGGLLVATLLTITYAGALIATAQAETRASAELYGLMPHAVAALQHRMESGRKP